MALTAGTRIGPYTVTSPLAGDAKRLAVIFAEDATVFYPSLPFPKGRASGRSDIETAWQQGFAAAGAAPRVEPKRTQIQTYGDIAIVTFELDANPSRFGRRTFVLQRKGETWKIIHLHASNRTE